MGQDMSREEEEMCTEYHKVQIHMVIAAVNTQSGTRFVLQKQAGEISLPYLSLKIGQSTSNVASSLFKKITGSNSDWFVVKQTGVVEPRLSKGNSVVVLYSVLIPEIVPLINEKYHWVTLEELNSHPNIFEMVSMACNYHRVN